MAQKEITLPERKWYHIIDFFTVMDEYLESMVKLLIELRKEIRAYLGLPVPTAPAIPAPAPITALPEKIATIPYPVYPITRKKLSVSTTEDQEYEVGTLCELLIITIIGDNVKIDFKEPTTDHTQVFPDGSVLVIRRSKKVKKIYFRSTSTTATVYVSEWRYGE